MSASHSDFEQAIVRNVANYGCHINFVFDPAGQLPDFSYSIGFPSSVAQPEVIIFGLARELMNSMINELYRQCADGLKLVEGVEVEGLIEGHKCVVREIASGEAIREHFGSSLWYRRETTGADDLRACQIVWPSAVSGLFPWDEDCSDEVRDWQPSLYAEEACA